MEAYYKILVIKCPELNLHLISVGYNVSINCTVANVSSTYTQKTFMEPEFLSLCQGIEAYHRIFKQGEYISDEDYKKKILPQLQSGIPTTIDKSFRASIQNRLNYLYEYSLSKRLKNLISEYDRTLSLYLPTPIKYAQLISDYRNKLTHYDENSYGQYIKPSKLSHYIEVLHLLLEFCFLSEMGFSKDEVHDFTIRNQVYARKFR